MSQYVTYFLPQFLYTLCISVYASITVINVTEICNHGYLKQTSKPILELVEITANLEKMMKGRGSIHLRLMCGLRMVHSEYIAIFRSVWVRQQTAASMRPHQDRSHCATNLSLVSVTPEFAAPVWCRAWWSAAAPSRSRRRRKRRASLQTPVSSRSWESEHRSARKCGRSPWEGNANGLRASTRKTLTKTSTGTKCVQDT